MTKLFGEALRKQILDDKNRAIKAIENRAKRINDGFTDMDDCFISQKVEERAIQEADKQLAILDGDGLMDYEAIFDEDGNEIWVHWVNTRFGGAYVGRGIFASSKKALLKKTGWTQRTIKVPAWTKYETNGTGLLGVYCGSIQQVRWHTNMVTGEYFGFPE